MAPTAKPAAPKQDASSAEVVSAVYSLGDTGKKSLTKRKDTQCNVEVDINQT